MNIIQRLLNRKTLSVVDNYEKYKYEMIKRLIAERIQKFDPQLVSQLHLVRNASEEMLLASPEAIIVTIATLYYMNEQHNESHTSNLAKIERNLPTTKVNSANCGSLRDYVNEKLYAELARIDHATSSHPWFHDSDFVDYCISETKALCELHLPLRT